MSYIYCKIGGAYPYPSDDLQVPTPDGEVLMSSYPPATSGHTPPYAYFEYRAQADGTWKEFELLPPPRVLVLHDNKLKFVSCGYLGTDLVETAFTDLPGYVAPPAAKRRVRKDITIGSGTTTTVDITPATGQAPYAVAPDIDPIATMNASKTVMYVPKVESVSTTSLTISASRTKGTLALSAGPLEVAVSGDVVSVWILEK